MAPTQHNKIAVISDVHSNLEAWLVVKADILKEKVNHLFCLGDVVGYGANPQECWNDVSKMAKFVLKGNHEYAVVDNEEYYGLNILAREGVTYSRDKLMKSTIDKIRLAPQSQPWLNDFMFCHGAYSSCYAYILDSLEAYSELKLCPRRFLFVGHTHTPIIYSIDQTKLNGFQMPQVMAPSDTKIYLNAQEKYNGIQEKYVVNVGSVGQPRDRDPRACYCLLEYDFDETKNANNVTVQYRRLEYNIKKAQKAILAAHLPERLAERLAFGE